MQTTECKSERVSSVSFPSSENVQGLHKKSMGIEFAINFQKVTGCRTLGLEGTLKDL